MKTVSFALCAFLIGGAAQAATLSIGSIPVGYQGSTSVIVPEATITSLGSDLYFGGAYSDPNSFCAISFGTCDADLEITFSSVVTNLIFDVGGWQSGDSVLLSIFDAGNVLLGTQLIVSDIVGLNLGGYGAIGRLFFDDSSSAAGVGYANFSFDQAAPIPVPASLPLLAGALGIFGLLARRKRT